MELVKAKIMGAIEPRLHSAYLVGPTRGAEVAELAEKIGMPLLEWQRLIIDDICKIADDLKFRKKTILLLTARQSGKTHLARMMMLAHLFIFQSRNVVIMSSNRSMALVTFRQLAEAIEGCPELAAQVKQIRYANGTESIELYGGARLDVVAATRDGSRGRTADFLFIDELREISEDGFAAAMPITRARPSSMVFLASNAGDGFSNVLNGIRSRALESPPETLGFYEYSAPQWAKIDDRKAWALANPSMGHFISEESIAESVAIMDVDKTRTETLCQWISSLVSPWPYQSVENCSDATLKMSPGPLTIFAFDVAPSRRDSSLVMGQLMPNGKIGVAVLELFHSEVSVDDLFIAQRIKHWVDIYFPRMICYDKYTTATIAKRLENAGVMVKDISGQLAYQAAGDLFEALSNGKMVHAGQDVLIAHFDNCAAKVSDAAFRIVRRKSAGPVDIAIGVSMLIHILSQPIAEAKIYA